MTEATLQDLEGRMDALEGQQRKAVRANGGDQGVLLARLDERMEQVYHWTSKADGRLHGLEKGQNAMSTAQAACAARQDTKWEGHDKEHEGHEREHAQLTQRKNIADVIAGGLGAFGIWLASKGLTT